MRRKIDILKDLRWVIGILSLNSFSGLTTILTVIYAAMPIVHLIVTKMIKVHFSFGALSD